MGVHHGITVTNDVKVYEDSLIDKIEIGCKVRILEGVYKGCEGKVVGEDNLFTLPIALISLDEDEEDDVVIERKDNLKRINAQEAMLSIMGNDPLIGRYNFIVHGDYAVLLPIDKKDSLEETTLKLTGKEDILQVKTYLLLRLRRRYYEEEERKSRNHMNTILEYILNE